MKNYSSKLKQAIEAHTNGNLVAAERLYKSILRSSPLEFDALHLLGVCKHHQSAYLESIQLIKRALCVRVDFPEAHFNLGNSFFALNRFDEAAVCYKKSIRLKPDYIDAYNNLGLTLRNLHKLHDAKQVFEDALSFSKEERLYYNYGNVLADMKLYSDAQVAFKHALDLNQLNYEAYDALGSTYAHEQNYETALIYYQKALELNPNFSLALSNISGALAELGRLNESLDYARRSIEIDPTSVSAISNFAASLHAAGFLEEAKAEFIKAAYIDPNFSKAIDGLGRIECHKGNWPNAIGAYERSFALDPTGDGLLNGVYVAVIAFITGDLGLSKHWHNATIAVSTNLTPSLHNARAYWLYLERLLSLADDKAKTSIVHHMLVIGESHSLTYANQVVVHNEVASHLQTAWVAGCKQWHIANALPNQYKAALTNHLNAISSNEAVLLVIGEIDCRPNEGIAKYLHKHPESDTESVIHKTIVGYLDWLITANAEKQHQLIISGVPAPNIDLSKLEIISRDDFIALIARFNEVLKAESLKRGFAFLDVYTMTNDGTGVSNGKWHIDEFHLTPAGGQEAFRNHLINP